MTYIDTLKKRALELRREEEEDSKIRSELDERARPRQAELQKVQQVLVAVQQTLGAADRSEDALAREQARAAAELGRAGGLLDRLRDERKAGAQAYDKAEKQLAAAKAKVQALEKKMTDAEEKAKAQQKVLDQKVKDVADREGELRRVQHELRELPQKAAGQQRRLASLAAELERALNAQRHDVAVFLEGDLKKTEADLKKALDLDGARKLKATLPELLTKLDAHQREVVTARGQLDQARKALADAMAELRAAEADQDPRSRRS